MTKLEVRIPNQVRMKENVQLVIRVWSVTRHSSFGLRVSTRSTRGALGKSEAEEVGLCY
jgi:hypothetical protein